MDHQSSAPFLLTIGGYGVGHVFFPLTFQKAILFRLCSSPPWTCGYHMLRNRRSPFYWRSYGSCPNFCGSSPLRTIPTSTQQEVPTLHLDYWHRDHRKVHNDRKTLNMMLISDWRLSCYFKMSVPVYFWKLEMEHSVLLVLCNIFWCQHFLLVTLFLCCSINTFT